MQSEQLLTQSEVFKDEIMARTECTNHPAEEVPEPNDHGTNFIRRSPNELIANSLILRVRDVLMRHSNAPNPVLQSLLGNLMT